MKSPIPIASQGELNENIKTFEHYLSENSNNESFNNALGFIKRGRNFVCYNCNGKPHFAPSRFLGYKDNTFDIHSNNKNKDGRDTDKYIKNILRTSCRTMPEAEELFLGYCESLGIVSNNHSRHYWILDFDIAVAFPNEEFLEGAVKIRLHRTRERNREVVKKAKERFRSEHGRLFCKICGFDFNKEYGKYSIDYIEAHHKDGVASRNGTYKIAPDDFVMVCSNCHSAIHHQNLSVDIKTLQIAINKKK